MTNKEELTATAYCAAYRDAAAKLASNRPRLTPEQIKRIETLLDGASMLFMTGRDAACVDILAISEDFADGYRLVPPEAA